MLRQQNFRKSTNNMEIFVLFSVIIASNLAQSEMWTVRNYPDPIDRYQDCGRVRPSFICDPSNNLPEIAADTIDDLVKAIYNETTVPCYHSGPRASRRKGYMVMVAIMPQMERLHTVNVSGYSYSTRFREAQHFAYHLGQLRKWGKHSSNCSEVVIILYSAGDDVLYTSTQRAARKLLTNTRVFDTTMQAMTRHYPFHGRIAEAIIYLVNSYGESLREDIVSV